MGCGPSQEIIPLRGSILQAETCQILSLAESPRWSPNMAITLKASSSYTSSSPMLPLTISPICCLSKTSDFVNVRNEKSDELSLVKAPQISMFIDRKETLIGKVEAFFEREKYLCSRVNVLAFISLTMQ